MYRIRQPALLVVSILLLSACGERFDRNTSYEVGRCFIFSLKTSNAPGAFSSENQIAWEQVIGSKKYKFDEDAMLEGGSSAHAQLDQVRADGSDWYPGPSEQESCNQLYRRIALHDDVYGD